MNDLIKTIVVGILINLAAAAFFVTFQKSIVNKSLKFSWRSIGFSFLAIAILAYLLAGLMSNVQIGFQYQEINVWLPSFSFTGRLYPVLSIILFSIIVLMPFALATTVKPKPLPYLTYTIGAIPICIAATATMLFKLLYAPPLEFVGNFIGYIILLYMVFYQFLLYRVIFAGSKKATLSKNKGELFDRTVIFQATLLFFISMII